MEGQEYTIRDLTHHDMRDFASLVSAPDYGKFSPFGNIAEELGRKMVEDLLKNYSIQRYQFQVVEDNSSGKLAGFIGYHPLFFEKTLQYMYFLGFKTKYWGTKLFDSATKAFCQRVFEKDDISRLIMFVHPRDTSGLMSVQNLNATYQREVPYFGAQMFLYTLDKQIFPTFI